MRGSVVKRGKTWSYIVDVARDAETGRRRQRWKGGFATRRVAERALAHVADGGDCCPRCAFHRRSRRGRPSSCAFVSCGESLGGRAGRESEIRGGRAVAACRPASRAHRGPSACVEQVRVPAHLRGRRERASCTGRKRDCSSSGLGACSSAPCNSGRRCILHVLFAWC